MNLNLYELYQLMLKEMGPTGWWPAETKEQIIIEAILIQNTTERNATSASKLIKEATNYNFKKILELNDETLQELVRPAGFMKNKSKAIKTLASWYLEHESNPEKINEKYGDNLRKILLKLHGVGPETADVLLTYIFDRPYFVADKYARTLLGLLGVETELLTNYITLHKHLALLPEHFSHQDAKEFHGLIDEFGKKYFHPMENFKTSFLADCQLDWNPSK
ncbi:MAG: endonuclease III domain-containing protein [Gemella sp.]|nr:endonuclease III domain-containing protein [Gemella sp.]